MSVSNTTSESLPDPRDQRSSAVARAILFGTLIAGTMDICAAIASWMVRGVTATRVLQGVAAGVLGSRARDGGISAAALGLFLHYFIMAAIVAIFVIAALRRPALTNHWKLSGAAYGVVVYAVMTFAVVPLSAAPSAGVPAPAYLALGLFIHITCVGLPIAFITHCAQRAVPTTGG